LLKKLKTLMQPVIAVIGLLEGDKYPTQSLILTLMVLLEEKVNEMMEKGEEMMDTFQCMLKDLKEEIALLWDKLPEDTLISSLLDPRLKSLSAFPENEVLEAWKLLKQEYDIMKCSTIVTNEISVSIIESDSSPLKRKRTDELNEILCNLNKRQKTSSKDEFDLWMELPPVDFRTDILEWWKNNERTFPVIANVARKYLAVPASQATTERSFRTAKKIVCDSRASLKPQRVERLVVWHQSSSFFMEHQ